MQRTNEGEVIHILEHVYTDRFPALMHAPQFEFVSRTYVPQQRS